MLLSEQIQKKKKHSTSLPHSLEHQVTLSNQRTIQSQASKSRKCPFQSVSCAAPGDWLWVSDWQTGWLRSERVPTRLTWFAGVTDTVRVRTRTHCDWLRLITWCQYKLIGKERFLRLMWPMTGENRKKPEVVIEVKDLNIFKHLLSITVVHTFKLSEFWKTFNLQLCCEKPWVHAHGFMSEANVSKMLKTLCIS